MSKYFGKRHIQDFVLWASATYGALWAIIEPLSVFFPHLTPEGLAWYGTFLGLSVVGGAWRAWPTKRMELQIPASDSTFEIKFGDVFDGEGVVVVPVNEYFDGELGDHVSRSSVHGQFIQNVLGGQPKSFLALADKALAGIEPAEVGVARSSGQRNRYAIGTVARTEINDRSYLLAVLSHTDLVSLKAVATVQDLWTCLAGLWDGIRQYAGGTPVRLPLIGSGLSGVGLPAQHVAEIILTSFICHTKERKVTDRVTLVLPRRLAGSVSLNDIKRGWT